MKFKNGFAGNNSSSSYIIYKFSYILRWFRAFFLVKIPVYYKSIFLYYI